MKTSDFTTTLLLDQSPQQVFNAVTNVREWWSETIKGNSVNANDEFEYEVKGVHRSTQKLIEVVPNKKVVWLITDSHMTFIKDAAEWKGTKVVFDIAITDDGKTKLVFKHEGLVPEVECYSACSPAWTQYIQHSLYNLITSGKGDPNLEGRRIKEISK
jgi:uncharacterized protein YndB with AHSA1/START domain